MTASPSMFAGNIFDSNPRTHAPNNQNNPGYVFEAKQIINFKSLVIMKRFDGMRDRYQGMIKKFPSKFTYVKLYNVGPTSLVQF